MTTPHAHDRGLSRDFPLLRRRRLMGLVGGTTVAALASAGTASPAVAGSVAETAPRPWDGANGVDVLTRSGIVRSDIRRGFGKATGAASGVPLTIRLNLAKASTGRPASGLAVYLWHADRDGRYSLYAEGLTGQNYLRGVQPTNEAGWASFTSVFPGTYEGRWPHLHVEVYPDVEQATNATFMLRAAQVALPADACRKVYATPGYESSRTHLADAALTSDPIFGDGSALRMASVTGDLKRGFTASAAIRV
jgi:protocatechuate 3,4-dioxygenase beta subunit